jgi:ornithine cyclodeaminase/alanine dehydrogenase-like protein (mu-crystallin family)
VAASGTIVLSAGHVERLIDMPSAVEVVAACLAGMARGEYGQPLRSVHRLPWGAGLGLMPAWRASDAPAFGFKASCKVPANAERGLNPHQGVVIVSDGETGQVRTIVAAGAVTAIRTAAATAVATRLLARRDASVLAVLGTGVQAHTHIDAIAAVCDLARVRVWGRSPERSAAVCAAAAARHGFPVEVAESVEAAVRGAGIVVTATGADEPLVRRSWLAPGALVNAVGSSRPTARELDTETVVGASLYVDSRESVMAESGDFLFAAAEAGLGREHIRGELGELLVGDVPGRRDPDELIVFKSLGVASEDLALALELDARARARGVGTKVEL